MPWLSHITPNEKFYYYDSQNNKPPLLDIHGFGVTSYIHYEKAAYPLEKYYRLIIPELPAHGELKGITKSLSIEFLCSYLENFINHLQIKNFKMIGRSVGGNLALNLLERSKVNIDDAIVIEAPIISYNSSFNSVFRFFADFISLFPNFLLTDCDHKLVLSTVKNLEVSNKILESTKAKFIYSKNDLYLTADNRNLVKELNKPLYINKYVGHFKDQTDESVIELVKKILQ